MLVYKLLLLWLVQSYYCFFLSPSVLSIFLKIRFYGYLLEVLKDFWILCVVNCSHVVYLQPLGQDDGFYCFSALTLSSVMVGCGSSASNSGILLLIAYFTNIWIHYKVRFSTVQLNTVTFSSLTFLLTSFKRVFLSRVGL